MQMMYDTYEDALHHVMYTGVDNHEERTGVGTRESFGLMVRYSFSLGFPLITTKKVFFDSVAEELLWFLRGETNISTLNCKIWDEWADENGDLGPIYGKQWRDFGGVDQIVELERRLMTNPQSRRLVVSAWNPAELESMALEPCHVMFQLNVHPENGRLDMNMYQRSADMMLGVPFNVASYSLLLAMLAEVHGFVPGRFLHMMGNAHVYQNHFDGAWQQLGRVPRDFPLLAFSARVRKYDSILEIQREDFELVDYNPHPHIALPVAV